MKLIRRRKQQTPVEKGLAIASKVIRALAAVRLARGALKGVRVAKRLPLIAAVVGAIAFVISKVRGGREVPQSPTPAPSPTPAASPPPTTPAT